MNPLITTALVGLLLSIYSQYVEVRKRVQKEYVPLCDITYRISCTHAFFSKQGSMLGVSNAIIGIIFYTFMTSLILFNQTPLVFYTSIIAMLGSVYLGYQQYFKVKTFCVVCTAMYVVNLSLLYFSWNL